MTRATPASPRSLRSALALALLATAACETLKAPPDPHEIIARPCSQPPVEPPANPGPDLARVDVHVRKSLRTMRPEGACLLVDGKPVRAQNPKDVPELGGEVVYTTFLRKEVEHELSLRVTYSGTGVMLGQQLASQSGQRIPPGATDGTLDVVLVEPTGSDLGFPTAQWADRITPPR
ncbi:hypothetical protein BH11MYX4_BH11MYX4_56420 [soil metagenome]